MVSWYLLLKAILGYYGFQKFPAQPALLLFYDDTATLIVEMSTDNHLCVYFHEYPFLFLKSHMNIFVIVTPQEGNNLKYLDEQIIQTDQGISIDQTQQIKITIINQ